MEQQIVDKEIFGQRFSEILASSSETTYTVADRVSLTPATISRYANGLMAPKIPTLYMLADIFHVNPVWLMGYDAPKFEPKPQEAPIPESRPEIRDEDIRAAFFGGADDLSKEEMDAMWDDAKDYIQYKLEQRRRKKNGGLD